MKDKQGREYAKVGAVKAGDILIADGGFPCIVEGARLVVHENGDDLFVTCAGPDGEGPHDSAQHNLDGQISGDGTAYVGLYPAEAAA